MPSHRSAERFIAAAVLALTLAGCASSPPAPPPPSQPEPTPVEPTSSEPVIETPVPPPEPVRAAPPPPVAIVLSRDIEAYQTVAQALVRELGPDRTQIHDLGGDPSSLDALNRELADAGVERVVAVGHLAAQLAAAAQADYRIFCQILNFEADDLLRKTSGGIKLLPPFDDQLVAWRAISPTLSSVGVIIGPDQGTLVAEIQAAAAASGIRLQVKTARSDKEALYLFKRMTPRIDGFWLLPDNRILSPGVIREIMAYGTKHRKQIVVFNDKLLALGALLSVTSDPQDVAEQAQALLARAERGESPVVVPLTRMRVRVNPEIADRLGVDLSGHGPELAGLR